MDRGMAGVARLAAVRQLQHGVTDAHSGVIGLAMEPPRHQDLRDEADESVPRHITHARLRAAGNMGYDGHCFMPLLS
jgi:hypothetical protein